MTAAALVEVARADEERAARLEALLTSINEKLDRVLGAQTTRGISPVEFATAMGISLCTCYRKIASGEIPSKRIGKRIVCDASALRPTTDLEIARLAREARTP